MESETDDLLALLDQNEDEEDDDDQLNLHVVMPRSRTLTSTPSINDDHCSGEPERAVDAQNPATVDRAQTRAELKAALQREYKSLRQTELQIKRIRQQLDALDSDSQPTPPPLTKANTSNGEQRRRTVQLHEPQVGVTPLQPHSLHEHHPQPQPSRLVQVVRDMPSSTPTCRPHVARPPRDQAIVNPLTVATESTVDHNCDDSQQQDFTERHSRLRLKSRLISSAVLDDRMRDAHYVPLSQLRKYTGLNALILPPKWVLIGVLVEMSERSGKSKYAIARVSDLDSTTINLMLFGKAYEALWNEVPGTVVAICTPELLKATDSSSACGVKINHPEHVLRLGKSRDMGHCQGRRRDGQNCSMIVNMQVTEYCDFHISQAVRSVAMNRPEFLNDQTRRQVASGKQKRAEKAKKMHGVYFTEGQVISTNAPATSATPKQPRPQDNALIESTIARSNFGAEVYKRMQAGTDDSSSSKKQKTEIPCIASRQAFREMFQSDQKQDVSLSSDDDESGAALAASTKRAVDHVRKNGISFERPDPNRPFSATKRKSLAADIERRKQEAAEIMAGPPKRTEDLTFFETEKAKVETHKQARRLASKFNVDLDKEQSKAERENSGSSMLNETEMNDFLRMCKREEYKEKHLEKMDATFQLTVTAYSCKQCQLTTEKVAEHCRQSGHVVTKISNGVKRFFRCIQCPSSMTTTVNSINPRQRCKQCDTRQWKPSSMLRNPVKKIVPDKPMVRGVEHGKFLQ